MNRTPSALVLALAQAACVPVDGIVTDAGVLFADAPALVCGHPYTPCCDGDRCSNGWRCRAGACIAPTPRCVASGVADPALTRGTTFETLDVPLCAAVPEILRMDDRAGAYRAGDGTIARVSCEGLSPGIHALRTTLHARMTIPGRDSPALCECRSSSWDVVIVQAVDGLAPRPLRGLSGQTVDGSCRAGSDLDETIQVPVGEDGRLDVRLDLARCDRGNLPTVCHFLEGTSMSVEPM